MYFSRLIFVANGNAYVTIREEGVQIPVYQRQHVPVRRCLLVAGIRIVLTCALDAAGGII